MRKDDLELLTRMASGVVDKGEDRLPRSSSLLLGLLHGVHPRNVFVEATSSLDSSLMHGLADFILRLRRSGRDILVNKMHSMVEARHKTDKGTKGGEQETFANKRRKKK